MPRPYSARGLARAKRVETFFRQHVRHTKDRWAGTPFVLEPFQVEHLVRPVYGRLDRRGMRVHHRALFGLPRWNGKSVLAAGLHLYHLFGEPVHGGEQYAFATTKAQAAIIFDTAKRMIQADPLLRAASKCYRTVIEIPETGCTFRALPFDADTAQGFHPSFATGDEVHVMRNLEMVEAMVTGMVARQQPLFVAITTEAAVGGGSLDQLREQWAADPRAYVHWVGARPGDDPHDPKVWKSANPASWITHEMLQAQYGALPLPVFQRLHLNMLPTVGLGARAINPAAWKACAGAPALDREAVTVVGVDAAPRRDKTAVVLDQRKADGIHHVRAWTFEAEPEAGLLDFDELKVLLRGLCRDYNVRRIVVDPAHLFAVMNELLAEGLPVEDMPQTASRMIPASMGLYDLVQLGRIRHGGEPVLTKHVLNAGVKEIPPSGWRMTKVTAGEHIDAAVALAMAAHIAESEAHRAGATFAESGGVWTL